MKTWIKGGLWGLGLSLFLGVILFFLLLSNQGIAWGGSGKDFFNESPFIFIQNILILTSIFFTIPLVIIGVIIGIIQDLFRGKK